MRLPVPTPVRRPFRRRGPASPHTPLACRAPFTSMYLDQHGDVRACCMNDRFPIGNVTEAPLGEIWHGAVAGRLRRAMEVGDLSLGCDFCREPIEAGRAGLAYARWFEQFPVEGPEPTWPRQLELSLTNTCNLRCVMCNGEWSSSIRAQVEGRPPLPRVYDEAFFAALVPFLEQVERVKFYGGEPFLASETLRVMDLLVDHGPRARCHVTTNGTQWTPRVERILSMLPVDVSVSLDAATPATYESIRRGSSWSEVRRNLDRFCEWAERRGTWVSLTFCLMTVNWHELGDFFRLADDLGVDGTVNVVMQPRQLAVRHLGVVGLQEVVASLERQHPELRSHLGQNRPMWEEQLVTLRRLLDDRLEELRAPGRRVLAQLEVATRELLDELDRAVGASQAYELLRGYGRTEQVLALDGAGRVVEVRPHEGLFGIPADELRHRHHSELQALLALRFGGLEHREQRYIGGVELSVLDAPGGTLRVLAARSGGDLAPRTNLYFSFLEEDLAT